MTVFPCNVEQLKVMSLKVYEDNKYKDEVMTILEKTVQTQAEEVIGLGNKMQLLIR